jgi:xanthine/uracil/vitamin C permease (AzgA family)
MRVYKEWKSKEQKHVHGARQYSLCCRHAVCFLISMNFSSLCGAEPSYSTAYALNSLGNLGGGDQTLNYGWGSKNVQA